MNYAGQRQLYATVAPQQAYVQPTYLTHPWVVTDTNDTCVAIFLPTSDLGSAVVREAVSGTTSGSLTSAEATELTGHMVSSAYSSLKQALQAQGLRTVSSVLKTATFNFSINNRQSCGTGGRIENTGSVTGTIDANGSGILQYQIRQTWTDCNAPLAGGKTLFINGDPYLSQSGTITFLNGVPSTVNSGSLSGGLKITILPDNITVSQCQNSISYNFPTWAAPSFTVSSGAQACGVQIAAGVITLPSPLGPVDPNEPAPPAPGPFSATPATLDLGTAIQNTACGAGPATLTGTIVLTAPATTNWTATFLPSNSDSVDRGDYTIKLAPSSGTGSRNINVTMTARQVHLTTGCHLTANPEELVLITSPGGDFATVTVVFKLKE